MDNRDIERMWKVASNNPNHDTNWYDPVVIAFANLVAAQEREECAKVCDEASDRALALQSKSHDDLVNVILRHHAASHQGDAAAIRKRGTT